MNRALLFDYPPGAGFVAAGSVIVLSATVGLIALVALSLGVVAWRRHGRLHDNDAT